MSIANLVNGFSPNNDVKCNSLGCLTYNGVEATGIGDIVFASGDGAEGSSFVCQWTSAGACTAGVGLEVDVVLTGRDVASDNVVACLDTPNADEFLTVKRISDDDPSRIEFNINCRANTPDAVRKIRFFVF